MGEKIKFTTFQVSAIVCLDVLVALFVGLMCGMTPKCISEETLESRSYDVFWLTDDISFERNKLQTNPWDELRLPPGIRPTYYTMIFQPDLTGSDIFYGWVDIEVNVTEPTEYPRVHAKNLNITLAQIVNSNEEEVPQLNPAFFFEYNQFYVMDVGGPLPVGEYTFKFEYTGTLGNKIRGFYKSSYMVPGETEPRYLATTDFEPTEARQAFPSFDEPNIKSYFKIKLRHEEKYIGLSNMPAKARTDFGDGMIETEFGDPEVKMSTYLVCFIVCDFKYVEKITDRGLPFRIYAPEYQLYQANYSLETGVDIFNYYEDYFGVQYPISKLDIIAIPDFYLAAMENWGIITYRARFLLLDEMESSKADKQAICIVLSHEIGHQWFGNLVTMDWWDDLWLNEGFATYAEYIGSSYVEPTWQMREQFVIMDLYDVFGVDQIVSSHPIVVDVNRPEEIIEVFDTIPYSKGASVIRMLNDFIGDKSFQEGLTIYFTDFAEANAKSSDLWASFQTAYNANGGDPSVDIAEVMDTWTKQMGFPVVKVEREGNNLKLNQDWFLVDPNANTSATPYESPYGYKWIIPFTSKFANDLNGERAFTWMGVDDLDVIVTGHESDWYIANFEQMGYYRVNYEENDWKALSDQLRANHTAIPITDRSGLLDDAFNLAKAEQLTYDFALDITLYLESEEEYVPWDAAYDNFLWLNEILRFQPAYGDWRIYIAAQTKKLLNSYTDWGQSLSHLDTFLRSDIIDLSCGSGDPECLAEAEKQFQNYLDGVYVSPDVRDQVLRFGMEQNGGQDNWDKVWEMYMDSTVSTEQFRLLQGLTRTRHVWILSRFMEYAMDESKIRNHDYFTVLRDISRNPVGNPIAWDFLRANWEYLVDRFGLDDRELGMIIPEITKFYCTEQKLQEMEDFFAKYPEAGAGTRGRQQALERVRTNINWVNRNQEVIQEWLNNQFEAGRLK
ncbi:Glutamyl aminopeptidase [Holothuria leucospilota]|uniref:Aminopeptidase n=1 Tax=Holothuria leucospilota TaxID=206669 RepID=A0A9Q0YGC6_HOLLE|nr:Glutamyl aminopeptidase [Holothuria leucospilota]